MKGRWASHEHVLPTQIIILFIFFTAALVAYGHSQVRGRIRAAAEAYTTAHGNAGSLTH